ncbi:hypothetical protein ACSBR2_041766 [Camellia fascicularis]
MPRVDDHQLRRKHFETFHIWFKEHSTPQPSTIDQITQQVRAELRDELREELRAEFSTHLQQMRAEMMALVSQGASVDPNRQVPDASSGHRAFRESAEDENPCTPPPEDQIFPE